MSLSVKYTTVNTTRSTIANRCPCHPSIRTRAVIGSKIAFVHYNICSEDSIYRCIPAIYLLCKPIQLTSVRNLIFFDFFVIGCWLIMGIIIFAETIFVIAVFEGRNDNIINCIFTGFICECFLADIALPVCDVAIFRTGCSFGFYLCQLMTCRNDGFCLFHCLSGFRIGIIRQEIFSAMLASPVFLVSILGASFSFGCCFG